MTKELLDALCENEKALEALATSVSENTEITNSHKGEVNLPFLDSAITDAFKLGWRAHLKYTAKPYLKCGEDNLWPDWKAANFDSEG